jgi:hypothetical protein
MSSDDSEKTAKFSKNLDRLQGLLGKKSASIERYLGLSNGYINNLVKQRAENPGRLLLALSEKGISTDWFLTGEGQPYLSNVHTITSTESSDQAMDGAIRRLDAQPLVQSGLVAANANKGVIEELQKRIEGLESENAFLRKNNEILEQTIKKSKEEEDKLKDEMLSIMRDMIQLQKSKPLGNDDKEDKDV